MTTAWLGSEKLCFLRKGLRVRLSSGVCFLTLVWIAGSLTLVGTTARAVPLPQEQKQAPAVTPAEKTAAEAFKNIQVLKEIPESKLIPAMFFISASLGVGCDHCHVTSDHGPWPLEKDDRPRDDQDDARQQRAEFRREDGSYLRDLPPRACRSNVCTSHSRAWGAKQ